MRKIGLRSYRFATQFPIKNKQILKVLKNRRHLRSIFRNNLAFNGILCTSESSSDDDSIYDEDANRNFHRGGRARDSGASSSSSFSDVNASPRHAERPRSGAYVKYQIPGNTSRLADVLQSSRHCKYIVQVYNNSRLSEVKTCII